MLNVTPFSIINFQSKMQLGIRHFMYNSYNEIIHCRNEQSYIIKHWLEIICCLILTLRYCLAIGSYHWNSPFQYWRYDPFTFYLKNYFNEAFVIYVIIIMTPFIIAIFIIYAIFLHPSNIYVSQVFYDLIVLNFQQLNQCLIDTKQKLKLIQNNYENNLEKMKTLTGLLWNYKLLKFLLKRFCLIWTRNSFQINPKMIDRKKLSQLKLKTAPIISLKCRIGLAKLVTIHDDTNYIIHIYGKLN